MAFFHLILAVLLVQSVQCISISAYRELMTKLGQDQARPCPVTPSCGSNTKYRNIDGTCNNLNSPLQGSALYTYRRTLQPEYSSSDGSPRGGLNPNSNLPKERKISDGIHYQQQEYIDLRFSQMFMTFGEFLVHDLMLTDVPDKGLKANEPLCCVPENENKNPAGVCSVIDIDDTCVERKRTFKFCSEMSKTVRDQVNNQSAYIDLSHVYGNNNDLAHQLRELKGGKLKTEGQNLISKTLQRDFRQNIHPGILAMHIIFVREHNRIATIFGSKNPNWDDEKIYQESRRIVIAEFQNIVYSEYLKSLFTPDQFKNMALNRNQPSNYESSIDATIDINLPGGAMRFGHSMITHRVNLTENGILQGGDDDPNGNDENWEISDYIHFGEDLVFNNAQLQFVLDGMSYTNCHVVDQYITDEVRDKFVDIIDLVATNILRGRDFGIPNFNKIREYCKLNPVSFEKSSKENGLRDLADENIKRIYKSPDQIDLFTGGLSEYPEDNGVLGPTFSCILKDQFERTKSGDRYFFTHGNVENIGFTKEQIDAIQNRRLSDVICDNTNVQNITPYMMLSPWSDNNGNSPVTCEKSNKLDLNLFTGI